MNRIAQVMNLRVNFQKEYHLHIDESNQYRNDIVDDYYQTLKRVLQGTPYEIGRHQDNNTISFTKYFTSVLDYVPKNLAHDNYHKLRYVFGVVLMELMDEIKTYRVDFSNGDAQRQDYSNSIVRAISQFNDFKTKSDEEYRFLAVSIEPSQAQVTIRYVEDARFRSFIEHNTSVKGEA